MSARQSPDAWQDGGACRGPHASLFFPPPHFERKVDRLARERQAKRICSECLVRGECLEYALAVGEPHGVWGGMNENERRELTEFLLPAS
jgi:WhiB family transcriptional regulator, redox-sensing transcriptional regulator